MTGKKKYMMNYTEYLDGRIEKLIKKDHPETHTYWQIACIMRSAAGLPYSDTPASGWREDGTPEMFSIVRGIVSAASGPAWDHPESVSKELFKLRYSLRDLKRQLLSIDKETINLINVYIDPVWCERFGEVGEFSLYKLVHDPREFDDKLDSPHHQTPIEAALEPMDWLEEGLTRTLEHMEDEARDRKDMGQLRTYAAKIVAFGVIQYMYQVNGKIPGLWTGQNPSGPYAKAVLEIFDILDIPHGSLQRAGDYATAKLKSKLEF